jgi:UDP-N-acetylglucosamine 2-epimerase (non-hydrolysing)
MNEITYASERFYDEVAGHASKNVHLILIATKPDIIKQVPLYKELKKRGHLVLLGHTGQHYDENLSGGMLKEFGVQPDFNLNVRGAMHEVVSQIIGRLGHVIGELKAKGKTVIPYVHGDTTTAMAAANAGYCHGFASVHVEAGIRTLTPRYHGFASGFFAQSRVSSRESNNAQGSQLKTLDFDVEAWHHFLMDRKNWDRGSQEPYPEQFNTRCAEAATGIHLAPVELVREFLDSEGYAGDRVFVVGNSVVDATEEALANAKNATVFEKYPALANGDFVRFCIHRRENCISEPRFRAIYDAMKALILDGRTVLLISLFQTESAFDRYGLREEVTELAKKPNFIYSPVWPQYTDVIAAMSKAAVCATDSGSMQEEMNVLGVPCVTLRFGSDRSESAINGGNLIAPPVDGKLIKSLIEYAWDNKAMRAAPKIYGRERKMHRCRREGAREGGSFPF